MIVYTMLLIVAIVLIAIDLDAHKAEANVWGWFIGGLFVLFSIPISLWGILQHAINYSKPFLQRREIRIMWMVPIYATDAVGCCYHNTGAALDCEHVVLSSRSAIRIVVWLGDL